MDYAVQINDVSVKFNLARERVDSLKEYFVRLLKGSHKVDEFFALKNVSFNIEKGDSFALVGSNGSGKSTMLKVISGIYKPTSGNLGVNGRIAPMIELGAGFDMDLTARENVFLNGAVLGYSRDFMKQNFNAIIDFAELWDFVDVPMKNFSSGMQARLGFSIATLVDPDILIVDEILSVGDAHFRGKCEAKMSEMKKKGVTLILVSHSINQILSVCKNAVWINKGNLMMVGTAEDVCNEYMKNKDL
ncbi:ABC transporter ATP-binding protein [Paenibacillus hemerocallicola]|uniref:ABC transporter ATP-binding protein n=1 Tax=Paenibacillus hemerocallicola TaxID=1172614 RepID=A0A5C4SX99_9BACL|nr:ABC transporter ATP-binding protein [Paenibacillus hemerocallicola]TNJ59759.1 ABC transporter ATP-binding protein [Paenibacillus hemerocallicola]